MPVTQPDLRLVRVAPQHLGVDVNRARIFADARQDRGLETAVVGVSRLSGAQLLDLRQGGGVLALTIERHGVVVARTGKAGGELEAAREQILGVVVTAQARGHLGEHADGSDVGRVLVQVPAQQRLGLGDAVVAQRGGRSHQARVTRGHLEKARTRSLSSRIVAHRRQVIGKGAPGIGKIGIERHRSAQRCHRILAPCQRSEGQTEFKVHRCPLGLSHRQRREHGERRGRIAAVAARNA